MDHTEAIRLTASERYLLDELSPELRDQFEEHFFGCSECALDIRAASLFVEQSKKILAEAEQKSSVPVAVPSPAPVRAGWLAWLRPAFAVPAVAAILAVIGYQNLVTYPQLEAKVNRPQVLPWATINTRTRGSITPVIATPSGSSFLLFVSIPPDPRYSRYIAELYNPAGKLEWSLTISGNIAQDSFPLQVPPGNRAAGNYSLRLSGISDTNQSTEIGRTSFELQIEK